MPFSRYLGDGQDSHDDQDAVDHNVTFSSHVQFQLPNLILNAPTVPPGGGAEALPAGFYPPASSSSLAWFSAQDGYSNPLCVLILSPPLILTLPQAPSRPPPPPPTTTIRPRSTQRPLTLPRPHRTISHTSTT